jgi:hypothetical protein
MRWIFYILLMTSVSVFAETVHVGNVQPDGSHALVLKKIVEKSGNRLRALVIDSEGREQQIYITSDDAIEIKRGLWVIRPGNYQTEI